MTKILMVTPRYPPNIKGGGEMSCKLLVDTLKHLGVHVDVCSADVLFPGVKHKEKQVALMYKHLKKIKDDYDIFHTYNMSLLPAVGLLTKQHNVNSIATLNGIVYSPTFSKQFSDHPKREYPINCALLKLSIKPIKKFVCLSKFMSDAWIKDGIPENKMSVITNAIVPNSVSLEDTVDDGTVRILFAGNYAKWRDLNLLMNAYARLPKMKTVLNIVGQGWDTTLERHEPKNFANAYVYYPSLQHDDLMKMFQNADIYVQPYKYHGIGRTMLEAAQSNTAIISTGKPEYFPHLHEDIALTTPNEMYETLEALITHNGLRQGYASRLKMLVKKYFTPEIIAGQYIKLYEELLCEK